nr:FGGY-family carbohydrate kinase [Tessaracoccus aquimaris]
MDHNPTAVDAIVNGHTALGIEFGSTRIKAVLIGPDHQPLATGGHEWRAKFVDDVWTYDLADVWSGLQAAYADLAADVERRHGVRLETVGAMGISALMHGYLAFDADGDLLVPFRTYQNTMTGEAAAELTQLFQHNIPQRWSIAHLYQAILGGEAHVADVDYLATLAAYVHWRLTGERKLGIGDASGMFPIDVATGDYDTGMVAQFDDLVADRGFGWKLLDILPEVVGAGTAAGSLTDEGAKLLDPSGTLKPGIPVAPAEGDAGTGMVATNSVARRTANVSAGTSVFAMVVLEGPLKGLHEEIDLVTTPAGDLVAMAHCINGTMDLSAWVGLFGEVGTALGAEFDTTKLFETLYRSALEAAPTAAACSPTTTSQASTSPASRPGGRCSCGRRPATSRSPTSCGRTCSRRSRRCVSAWMCCCAMRASSWTRCSPTAASSRRRGSRRASSPPPWTPRCRSARSRAREGLGAWRCSRPSSTRETRR